MKTQITHRNNEHRNHQLPPARSMGAQRLHTLIMEACNAINLRELENRLSDIRKYIDDHPSAILLERSANKYSHLDDALHIPFERQQHKGIAGVISFSLFTLLCEKMQSRLHNDEFPRLILSN